MIRGGRKADHEKRSPQPRRDEVFSGGSLEAKCCAPALGFLDLSSSLAVASKLACATLRVELLIHPLSTFCPRLHIGQADNGEDRNLSIWEGGVELTSFFCGAFGMQEQPLSDSH